MEQKFSKVVLAYSGGLDTSVIIPWLKEHYGCEVIAVAANVGQGMGELEGLEEKAIKTGASKCYIEDLTEEFVNDFIVPTVRAARSTRANTCWALPLRGRSSRNGWLRSPRRRAPTQSSTAAPARATTRCGSS